VQTGLPSQRFFDISATALNIYAGAGQAVEGGVQRGTSYFSGKSTDITVYLADRLANPVPDGTPVVFVAEGGQINSSNVSSCLLKDGGCTVKLIGQEFRPWGSGEPNADPRPGRVTVLAYADGQEAFTDTNRNNRYDPGEPHEELGRPYIDLDENNVFQSNAITQLVRGGSVLEQSFPLPAGVEGTAACVLDSNAGVDAGLSVENTCNRLVRTAQVTVHSIHAFRVPVAHEFWSLRLGLCLRAYLMPTVTLFLQTRLWGTQLPPLLTAAR
jgi:hypothetical protein